MLKTPQKRKRSPEVPETPQYDMPLRVPETPLQAHLSARKPVAVFPAPRLVKKDHRGSRISSIPEPRLQACSLAKKLVAVLIPALRVKKEDQSGKRLTGSEVETSDDELSEPESLSYTQRHESDGDFSPDAGDPESDPSECDFGTQDVIDDEEDEEERSQDDSCPYDIGPPFKCYFPECTFHRNSTREILVHAQLHHPSTGSPCPRGCGRSFGSAAIAFIHAWLPSSNCPAPDKRKNKRYTCPSPRCKMRFHMWYGEPMIKHIQHRHRSCNSAVFRCVWCPL